MSRTFNVSMQVVATGHPSLADIEEEIDDAIALSARIIEDVNFISATPAEIITNDQEEDSDIRR